MKVTREKTENSQAFLTIEMEPDEMNEYLALARRHLSQRTAVPGFRKGKAPPAILERYIGKESILEDAIHHLLPEAYEKAIKEQEIKAIAQPQIEVTQTEPVIFKAIVPLVPTVELGDYRSVKLTPEPVNIAEDDVNTAMEELRHQHALWEPAERAVDFSDLIFLDIESHVEGKPFINQKGAQYLAMKNAAFPAPGFPEQLVGMKKDEEKEFTLTFPADYARKELAGKECSFKVKIIEIKQEKLPELNDEFAKQISADFKTLDSLREQVSKNMKLGAEEKAKADFEDKVIEAVVDLAKVDFPPVIVEAEIDQLINERARRLQMDNKGLEEYLKTVNKTGEQLREEFRPAATKRVKSSLVLGKFAEEDKIEASDAEVSAEIENMLKSTADDKKDTIRQLLDATQSRESIRQLLITRKTIERLTGMAKGTEVNQTEAKEEKNE